MSADEFACTCPPSGPWHQGECPANTYTHLRGTTCWHVWRDAPAHYVVTGEGGTEHKVWTCGACLVMAVEGALNDSGVAVRVQRAPAEQGRSETP